MMVQGRQVNDRVSFDVNPTSRAQLETLVRDGHIAHLLHAGARLHQAGCNGCIGMGQAPATNELSLRTVPRNFPGRSGTREDKVCLVSPETATASALTGVITDPRTLGIPYLRIADPDHPIINRAMFMPPLPLEKALQVDIVKGPNIASLPNFEPLPDEIEVPVLLKMENDVSTDEIMPPGLRVLPFRSNIPRIAEFSFDRIDPTYATRAKQLPGHVVVGGGNYGQGSSREHAALGPQYLGLRAVLAKGFARIHAQNLINFGVLPLTFVDPADYDSIQAGDVMRLTDLRRVLTEGNELIVENVTRKVKFQMCHSMSPRQVQFLLRGGLISWMKERLSALPESGDA
jgi:aconitate hydratase